MDGSVGHSYEEASDFGLWLQNAIDNAAVSSMESHAKWPLVRSHIKIPSGVHYLDKPIKLRSGTVISGDSQASTVIVSGIKSGDPLFSSDPDEEIYGTQLNNLHLISKVKWTGNAINLYNANRNCYLEKLFIEGFSTGIWTQNCYTTAFRDIGIYRCGDGFVGENLTNGRLDSIKIENCTRHGLHLLPSSKNTTTGTSVLGLVAQGNGGCGVLLEGLDDIAFSTLFLEGNGRRAMRLESEADGSFVQLRLIASRRLANCRNGNVSFRDVFVTPGHSKLGDTPAIEVLGAENVHFSGGYVRTFGGGFPKAFFIGMEANRVHIEGMTFQGFLSDDILDAAPEADVTLSRLLMSRPTSRYVPYPDQAAPLDTHTGEESPIHQQESGQEWGRLKMKLKSFFRSWLHVTALAPNFFFIYGI